MVAVALSTTHDLLSQCKIPAPGPAEESEEDESEEGDEKEEDDGAQRRSEDSLESDDSEAEYFDSDYSL